MARQLVFTSAPQGLTPGRTGYGTVARHTDLRERLVPALERLSVFPSDWQPTPIICAFRLVDVGGTSFPVLSRLIDAGHDYTHRNRYLAHHLIFDPAELAGAPTPADIFLRWPGWLANWDSPPRWLDEKDLVDVANLPAASTPALPAQTWQRMTGDAARAALLTDGGRAASQVLRCTSEQENNIILLLRESSALLSTAECWRTEFTTCLQSSESAADYRWAGVRAGSPADTTAIRTGALLDLTQPATLPPAPSIPAAQLAREGPLQAKTPVVTVPARQTIPLIIPAPPKNAPTPPAVYKPVARVRKAVPKPALNQSTAIIIGIVAAVIIVGIVGFIFLKPLSPESSISPTVDVPPVAPMPVFNPEPAQPKLTASPTPAPPTGDAAITNEQVLMDIQRMATDGRYLDSLTRWKSFATDAPEFAQAHIDVLKSQLLPGARKEWLAALERLKTQLANGPAGRADLEAQLAAMRDFPQAWPVTNPGELTRAADATDAIFKLLNQLPDAPVFIVDGLTTTGAGADYQDATVALALPELNAILAAGAAKFHVSAASATSIIPPSMAQWFNFNVQSSDFSSGDFLILQDTSRGEAGGRFLQLLVEGAGKIRLTWRLYQPQSDFFQRYPANAPLAPTSREMWLHFAGEPPLASFYLLLRRPDSSQPLPWRPLPLPLAWIQSDGSPAQVRLPTWLANNLPWQALPGQSFHLVPTLVDPSLESLVETTDKIAVTPAAAQYDAQSLVSQLNDKIRDQQTELARVQEQLTNLQTAANGPANQQPTPEEIDQATENVKKLQSAITTEQAAVQKVSDEAWPSQAAPWMLYDTLASKDSLIFLQFTSHETGSTP